MTRPHIDVVAAAHVWWVGQRVVWRQDDASLTAELCAAAQLNWTGDTERESNVERLLGEWLYC